MRRFVAAGLLALVLTFLLLSAMVFTLAAAFLAYANVLPLWLAAFATAATNIAIALVIMLAATRGSRARRNVVAPRGELAAQIVDRHPLGVAGTALAAGVLVSSSERTRAALIKSVDSYVRATHQSAPRV